MLELINVGLTLEGDNGEVQILKEINLKLEQKKIYVVTGPNGGGKSSIAKVIMGIYPATSGEILIDSANITKESITERARLGIGYAFQQPPRFKGMKVRDMLELAAGDNNVNPCDLLFDVGLCAQDYLDREINASFSGGELKRLEIASVLARKLKVALFDEPEAGIDLWSFQKLTETFERLNEKYDTTIVIISHQERILKLADQVIVVANGKISEITDKDKILGEIEHLDTACRCRNACEIGGKANAVKCDR
ncbi:Fe-S cluster assembly ATP-binding protein [Desulfonispora thiosulfatigenes DSM 11270]|uniref:Fe-S cluster assembly ATP-binding protein n=1 Tax=Desulfonispora thiosulfatigenes DSM 11270 TaxID=656914 RepID=A0A1W1UI26_DESTI|nr:ATP-binding cassette domain-containing protein [Desulfonispora thiosulfatigenes]SMB80766.1 Fe-S cluster assembly ATP-binding protein [Desulfonispora thiosulfatigenes DSM 11270]